MTNKTRRVRVEFEYDSELAIAVKAYCFGGQGEEATPAEMRRWFRSYGESCLEPHSDVIECPDFEEMEEAS